MYNEAAAIPMISSLLFHPLDISLNCLAAPRVSAMASNLRGIMTVSTDQMQNVKLQTLEPETIITTERQVSHQ